MPPSQPVTKQLTAAIRFSGAVKAPLRKILPLTANPAPGLAVTPRPSLRAGVSSNVAQGLVVAPMSTIHGTLVSTIGSSELTAAANASLVQLIPSALHSAVLTTTMNASAGSLVSSVGSSVLTTGATTSAVRLAGAVGGTALLTAAALTSVTRRCTSAVVSAGLTSASVVTAEDLVDPAFGFGLNVGKPTPGSYVQGATQEVTGSNAVLAFPGNVTAGNLIVVAVGSTQVLTESYPTSDSQGNSYTNAPPNFLSIPGGYEMDVMWAVAKTTGPCTVTVGPLQTSENFFRQLIHEYVGYGPLDVQNNATHSGSTSTLSLVTTAANDLLFAWCIDNNGVNSYSAPLAIRLTSASESTGDNAGATNSAGSQTVTCNTAAGGGGLIVVAFKATGFGVLLARGAAPLTSAVAPSLAVAAPTRRTNRVSSALAGSLAVTASFTSGSGVALTAALASSLGVGATNAKQATLSAALSGSLSAAGTNAEVGSLSAALAPNLAVAASLGSTTGASLSSAVALGLAVTASITAGTSAPLSSALSSSLGVGAPVLGKGLLLGSSGVAGQLSVAASTGTGTPLSSVIGSTLALSAPLTAVGALSALVSPSLAVGVVTGSGVAFPLSSAMASRLDVSATAVPTFPRALTSALTSTLLASAALGGAQQLSATATSRGILLVHAALTSDRVVQPPGLATIAASPATRATLTLAAGSGVTVTLAEGTHASLLVQPATRADLAVEAATRADVSPAP